MHQLRHIHTSLWGSVVLIIGVLTGCGSGTASTAVTTMATTTTTTTTTLGISLSPPTVITDKGTVIGHNTATMHEFLGIPYAAPPVGDLRWRAPQSAAAWSSPLTTTSFTTACAQAGPPFAYGTVSTASTSEDCLYLNVYVPKGTGPFPVMVWIHGGGLSTGASRSYDPTALVNSGVIMVTFNYRLGAFGFLAHPALTAEGGTSGNYGLMDQQAALGWVQANIAAFGGNPRNVTLFGQSAGGLSTLAQVVSPTAASLFHKAIVESGTYGITLPPLSETEPLGQGFATAAGCASQTLACMRGLSASMIIANESSISSRFGSILPSVDGSLLTMSIDSAFSSGNFNKIPMIEGTNQHEFSLNSAISTDIRLGHEVSASDYPVLLDASFNTSFSSFASNVLNNYPLTPAHTPAWTFDNVFTDIVYSCNGRLIAQWGAASGEAVYTYEFADADAPVVLNLPARTEGFGAYHAAELQYVFPSTDFHIYYGAPFTSAQTALSSQMVGFWSQFAKTGNPNASGAVTWPAYTVTNDTYLTLAPNAITPTTKFAADHSCAFWGFQ